MTKEKTKPAAKEKVKEAPAAAAEFKYGIADIEKATGLLGTSIRVGLRASTFKKTGRTWGWNTKEELDKVLAFFKERKTRAPEMTKGKAPAKTETKAPAKSEAKAKPAAKASGKTKA